MTDKQIPAFPFECQGPTTAPEIYYGMTLRDYFAAKAMSEMTWSDKEGSARECYEMADAMMEARK